jgi:hypothetical protein
MQPEAKALPNHEPAKGLPPVAPPSGKHIVQLFIVPALIVAVALGILWVFERLVGGARTPEQFLRDLSNPNTEVRWRAASDLAQVLNRDQDLASNPTFALDLAGLLRQALRDGEEAERSWAERSRKRSPDEAAAPEKALQDQRAYVQFLTNCLGSFSLPVGVPLLNEIAIKEEGADAETVKVRRQNAVWALAKLGEKLNSFEQLPESRRAAVRTELDREADAAGPSERGEWARVARGYLRARAEKRPWALGVDRVLARCATAGDPLLRKSVAVASAFWEGSPEENALLDATLLKLTFDQGQGAESGEAKVRGVEVRYKATEVLARRGSDRVVSRFPVLQEMLDEEQQARNFRSKFDDGRDVTDEPLVYSTVKGALHGLVALHAKKPDLDLSRFKPAVEQLKHSEQRELQREALSTGKALYGE